MAGMQPEGDHVLFPAEAEVFINELIPTSVENIGSDRWSLQRERIEKLMLQSITNASQQSDDFITNLLVSYDKVKVVIHELICIDVWKRNVFPLLFKQSVVPTSGFPTYLILYHEASIIGLLETILFYRESCEELDETIIDLVDYCYRKITELVNHVDKYDEKEIDGSLKETPETIIMDLYKQEQTLSWGIAIKCLSIIHYVSDHLKVLPLSVSTRLLNTHDFPCLLVSVLEMSPWSKTSKTGKPQKYDDGKWHDVDYRDNQKVTKVQAQVWLTIYRLLMDEYSQTRYEYTHQRKQHLLKLQGYLHDPLIEQIPLLEDIKRYLQHLSLADPPPAKTALILEQVPILYDQQLLKWKGKWNELAKKQSRLLLAPDPARLKADATRWIDSYNFDVMERLSEGPPKCALCGKEATKRCSRCRSEWYCGRECQVKQWKKHKTSCDLLKDAVDGLKS